MTRPAPVGIQGGPGQGPSHAQKPPPISIDRGGTQMTEEEMLTLALQRAALTRTLLIQAASTLDGVAAALHAATMLLDDGGVAAQDPPAK